MTQKEAYKLLEDNAQYFRNEKGENKVVVDGRERKITTQVRQITNSNEYEPIVRLDAYDELLIPEYLSI